jgi:hypothetical protein
MGGAFGSLGFRGFLVFGRSTTGAATTASTTWFFGFLPGFFLAGFGGAAGNIKKGLP